MLDQGCYVDCGQTGKCRSQIRQRSFLNITTIIVEGFVQVPGLTLGVCTVKREGNANAAQQFGHLNKWPGQRHMSSQEVYLWDLVPGAPGQWHMSIYGTWLQGSRTSPW